MHVFMRDDAGETYPLDVEAMTTVGDLKCQAANILQVSAATVRLFLLRDGTDEEELDDDTLELGETEVCAGDVISAELRPLFEVGHRVEARDRVYPSFLCVATIEEVDGRQVKVHFDGWSAKYDYWTADDTLDLAPIGTCERLGYKLEAPRGIPFVDWDTYLRECNLQAAPVACFARVSQHADYFSNGPHKIAFSFPQRHAWAPPPLPAQLPRADSSTCPSETLRDSSSTTETLSTTSSEEHHFLTPRGEYPVRSPVEQPKPLSDPFHICLAGTSLGIAIGMQTAATLWIDHPEKKSAAQSVAAVFTFMGSAVAALNLGRRFLYPPNSV